MKRFIFFSLFFVAMVSAHAAITVRDDAGATVSLPQPAKRVVSLAPHVTEMLFAAGGGERIVGVVSNSDYPAAASGIARVGDHHRIDLERVVALKPDLLVVWLHGSAARQIDALRKLGIPLFYSEPHRLDDIPDSVIRLGQLMGTEQPSLVAATALRKQLAALASRYRDRPAVRVFYQVWERPLYTLSGRHIVSDAIRLCGGENIFASLSVTAPTVGIESVLLENPEAIISANTRDKAGNGLEYWKQYSALTAARRGNLFTVDADLINRAGPRMIDGAAALCARLEEARARRGER